LVGGNTNLPIIAMAEKISEHIRYGDMSVHARLADQKRTA
jgi:choline dehydrogenase-like flavoprotein